MQHGGAAFSTVASQVKGLSSIPPSGWGLSVWRLHVLPLFTVQRHAASDIRLIDDS